MKLLHVMIVLGSLMPGGAMADQVNLAFGGDAYAAGQTATLSQPVARDAFAAGFTVALGAPVSAARTWPATPSAPPPTWVAISMPPALP